MKKQLSFFKKPDSVLNFYSEYGYHIEYGVISDDVCDEIQLLAHQLACAKSGNFAPVMMPHRENEQFLHYMKNPQITAIMSALLAGNIAGLQSQFFFMKPGTRGFTPHQDNHFVQARHGAFASAWLALEDTCQENGGLVVYPGTHKMGTLPVVETNLKSLSAQDPNAYRTEVSLPVEVNPIHVSVPKGAVLFIHGDVVHASNTNASKDRWRHVLLNTYILQGEAFRPGRDAKRVEISL
ncbi:phytanoyl-CoA dioxygenase family protein [Thalassotalea euphylliae]|uniref:Phytanoyl-CoA dioxygenase family protein n=1 Tax=Thalassotalea euphylliae TaxID=1655234 RepID=A0A3E0UDP4_9GAMM|nr:phytanoyl-CoA dioxygenase family protein [Thalassotalea euphylliae]REL34834.1 hypothetical protein DXX92_05365 [Thalassotalea euphylliae]